MEARFSPDGRLLASPDLEGTVEVYSVKEQKLRAILVPSGKEGRTPSRSLPTAVS